MKTPAKCPAGRTSARPRPLACTNRTSRGRSAECLEGPSPSVRAGRRWQRSSRDRRQCRGPGRAGRDRPDMAPGPARAPASEHVRALEPATVDLVRDANHVGAYWLVRDGRTLPRPWIAIHPGVPSPARSPSRVSHAAVSARPRAQRDLGRPAEHPPIFSMFTTRRRMLSMSRRSTWRISTSRPTAARTPAPAR